MSRHVCLRDSHTSFKYTLMTIGVFVLGGAAVLLFLMLLLIVVWGTYIHTSCVVVVNVAVVGFFLFMLSCN